MNKNEKIDQKEDCMKVEDCMKNKDCKNLIDSKDKTDGLRAHWNVFYRTYTDDLEDRFVSNHIKVFEKVLEQFKGKKDLKVLEIACGSGRFSKYLMDNHADIVSEYVITDISDEMIKLTEERMSDHLKGGKVKALRVDAKDLDQHKFEKFDLICAFLVIQLVSDRKAVFKNICNLLKPDSRLLIVVPCDYENSTFFKGTVEIAEKFFGGKSSDDSPFFQMGKIEFMREELDAAGLEIEDITSSFAQYSNDPERNFSTFYNFNAHKPEFKNLPKEKSEELFSMIRNLFDEMHKNGKVPEMQFRNYVVKFKD